MNHQDRENGRGPHILKTEELSKNFGGLTAVSRVSFRLGRNELKGLIGPNGAGKSTLFNLISGLYPPSGGRVILEGEEITDRKADYIARKGVARTFQTVKLLAGQTVLETMMTAFFLFYKYNVLDAVFWTRRYEQNEKALRERAMDYLALLGVDHLAHEYSNELAYGFQRKVSIAGALCLSPRVLLLDEPMAGLTHSEKDDLMEIILKIKEQFDLSVMIVEHDMKVIMNLCQSILVMNQGVMIAEGTASEIRQNPEVVEAYLGAGQS